MVAPCCGWLLALGALAAAGEGGDACFLAKGDTLPNGCVTGEGDIRRVKPLHEALPDGHRLRLEFTTVSRAVTGYADDVRYVSRITTLDAAGRQDGQEIEYGDWYRHPSRIAHYRQGKPHGLEQRFEPGGGTLLAEIPWEDGQVNGVRRSFHADGKVQSETPVKKGETHGESRTYDRQGRVIRTVPFVKGKRHGESVDYWPEAPDVVQRRIPYKNGEVHGLATSYYLNGKIKWECPFKDNLQHGTEKHYAVDGTVEKTVQWKSGDPVPVGAAGESKKGS